jgi:hypothetical protein
MNSIQIYVIKFVIYLRQFGGITPDTPVFSTNKIDIIYRTEILLFKVVLNINNDNRTEAFFNVLKLLSNPIKNWLVWFRFMVFNATFKLFSVTSCRSVLLLEETGVAGENRRPAASV